MKFVIRKIIIVLTIGAGLIFSFPTLSDAQDSQNQLLLNAASKGDTAAISKLIHEGTDVNVADDEGKTPLILATIDGHLAAVNELLARGAKTGITDKRGMTAFAYAWGGKHEGILYVLAQEAEKRVAIKTEVLEMSWIIDHRPEAVPPDRPDTKLIVLKPVEFQEYRIHIFSAELASYLESLGSKTVPVVFELRTSTEDGSVFGYMYTKVGDRTSWIGEAEGSSNLGWNKILAGKSGVKNKRRQDN